jgi:glycerol-3-phosphate acyltransferase PlsY
MTPVALLAVAYLLGSVPTGLLVVRWARGVDVRASGSGNIGATNVVRAAGWGWGIVTLLLDAVKGALIPLVLTGLAFPPDVVLLRWQIAAGVLALVGNIFNPWLRFRGGKGVGTAIGMTAVIAPVPCLWALIAFAAAFGATRIVSVGSLSAGLVFALAAGVVYLRGRGGISGEWLAFCGALAALVFFTHRANIRRLLAGRETRLTKRE